MKKSPMRYVNNLENFMMKGGSMDIDVPAKCFTSDGDYDFEVFLS